MGRELMAQATARRVSRPMSRPRLLPTMQRTGRLKKYRQLQNWLTFCLAQDDADEDEKYKNAYRKREALLFNSCSEVPPLSLSLSLSFSPFLSLSLSHARSPRLATFTRLIGQS